MNFELQEIPLNCEVDESLGFCGFACVGNSGPKPTE